MVIQKKKKDSESSKTDRVDVEKALKRQTCWITRPLAFLVMGRLNPIISFHMQRAI
jgi:hypothetical protein